MKVMTFGRIPGTMALKVDELIRGAVAVAERGFGGSTPSDLLCSFMNYWKSELPLIRSGNNQNASLAYEAEWDLENQKVNVWKIDSKGARQFLRWMIYVL